MIAAFEMIFSKLPLTVCFVPDETKGKVSIGIVGLVLAITYHLADLFISCVKLHEILKGSIRT